MDGVWAPYQEPLELHTDPQVVANGYLATVETDEGPCDLVTNPVQFDERPFELTRAPGHGEQTEELLLELGYDWDDIIRMKDAGAIT